MARRTIKSTSTEKWTWGIQTFDSAIVDDDGWGDDGTVTDPDGNEYEIDVQVILVKKIGDY